MSYMHTHTHAHTHTYTHTHTHTQATEVISKLYAAHHAGEKNVGFDVEGEGAAVKDVAAAGIWDLFLTKFWSFKLATNAATTVLRVDQVSPGLVLKSKRSGDLITIKM